MGALWAVARKSFCLHHTRSIQGRSLCEGSLLRISDEIREAIQAKQPVVALETAVYTHGFPYPENIGLFSHLEHVIRLHGAIPATISILHGAIKIGMSPKEVVELLKPADKSQLLKISRRDVSRICGLGISDRRLNGGTTIAATLLLARLAGIKVVASGGLGGVHKDGENSMDVSADLTELGRTPVALVTSGCKSFLDVPRTLEYLETQGVGVSTFADGRSGDVDFPSFWTRDSGIPSPSTICDEKEAASIVHAQLGLGISSGLLFANPIPQEHSLSKSIIERITLEAVNEARSLGFRGNENTPFVLSRIREKSEGKTVDANRSLIESNVARGAKLAVELMRLTKADENGTGNLEPSPSTKKILRRGRAFSSIDNLDILVAGSLAVDTECDYRPSGAPQESPIMYTSNPAKITQTVGGVGHNIATAAHYSNSNVLLCSLVGSDALGTMAIESLARRGLATEGIRVAGAHGRTAQYVSFNEGTKGLLLAMADMDILSSENLTFEKQWTSYLEEKKPKWLALDSNWSEGMIYKWVSAARAARCKIAYEPVSIAKSTRLLRARPKLEANAQFDVGLPLVDLVCPNEYELHAMARDAQSPACWSSFLRSASQQTTIETFRARDPKMKELSYATLLAALDLLAIFPCVLTKLGKRGVLLSEVLSTSDPRLTDPSKAEFVIFENPSGLLYRRLSDRPCQPRVDRPPSLGAVYLRLFQAHKIANPLDVVSVNGAGDTFLGVLLSMTCSSFPSSLEKAVHTGQKCAALTLCTSDSVSTHIKGLFENSGRD